MKNNMFKMNDFYYTIVEINCRPFVVFSMTEDFEEGFISIYSLQRESILTAYDDFEEMVQTLKNMHRTTN